MMDIHSHILPGVDDGLTSFDDALYFLEALAKQGVKAIFTTPHVNRVEGRNNRTGIRTAFVELFEKKAELGIPIDIHPAAEVLYTPDIKHLLQDHPEWFLGHQRRYFLMEFFGNMLPVSSEKIMLDLLLEGIVPVLAHIERLQWSPQETERMVHFKDSGVLMQINAGSIMGKYGRHMKKKALRLIKEGWCQFVASDSHRLTDLKYSLPAVYPVLSKRFNRMLAARLTAANAENLLEGKPIV